MSIESVIDKLQSEMFLIQNGKEDIKLLREMRNSIEDSYRIYLCNSYDLFCIEFNIRLSIWWNKCENVGQTTWKFKTKDN